jgi:hypothetical protein
MVVIEFIFIIFLLTGAVAWAFIILTIIKIWMDK